MNDDIVIEAKNLYKVFGPDPDQAFPLIEKGLSKEEILDKTGCVVAINDANFQVHRGEMFVVMGLSGSGKSTVIRCLNRLIDPTRGQVLVGGDDIMQLSGDQLRAVRRNKMSMVFQHFGLLPQRTVLKNVEFGLEISNIDPAERRKKAQDALELVGLAGYESSLPSELSGGMQQRVGLARALANDPEVLLMDEAFSALDPLIRTQMQDELLALQEKMHKTVVFITHDLDEALKIGDRIVIMGPGGGIRQIGTPEEILTEPADDYVAAFVENVDRTKVITASSIMKKADPVVTPKDGPSVAVRRMEKLGLSTVFVTDHNRVLRGIVNIDDAVKARKDKTLEGILREDEIYTVWPDTPLSDLMGQAMASRYPMAVVDHDGRLLGLLDRATILAEVGVESDQVQTLVELQQSQDDESESGETPTQEQE
ncbi:MAG TPA: glycine betaine/L-proline ABC transporter ATP-binding protein [Candidatus Krumholzibacteria bacterium]|nr:glycine betaine/L-proline ABC transporter ATP-binding protein [Candidatus Krumholzibacteria bacterium]